MSSFTLKTASEIIPAIYASVVEHVVLYGKSKGITIIVSRRCYAMLGGSKELLYCKDKHHKLFGYPLRVIAYTDDKIEWFIAPDRCVAAVISASPKEAE